MVQAVSYPVCFFIKCVNLKQKSMQLHVSKVLYYVVFAVMRMSPYHVDILPNCK